MSSDPFIKGSVRRSQLITTYGIGSVVALGDESFMVAGLDHWPPRTPDIHEPRLERVLRVRGFVSPPASDRRDIPVVRFPRMYYCPVCRRLDSYGFFTGSPNNKCSTCGVDLVPSRFVTACRRGHVDDFPYHAWAHEGKPADPGKEHRLSIEAGGASASLSDILITCSCKEKATMQGSFGRIALKGITRCRGYRPWLGDYESCDEVPRALQRGASNVWFPVVRSALSIPPWSEGAFKVLNRHWTFMRAMPDDALAATIRGSGIADGTPYSVDDLVTAARERRRREQDGSGVEDPNEELRREEYSALIHGMPEKSGLQEFVCIPVTSVASRVAEWIDHVAQVKRLHEVRALQSFTRLQASSPADPPEHRAPLGSRDEPDWLPGIVVLGEGIFLRLDTARLARWETREDVRARAARINRNYRDSFIGGNADREITPRLLLIHTLAHALIDQFALEAGYPAASLRERLYVSDEMAGLLIYTATTDAAGSLGGVVALARRERLAGSFLEALGRASWCSADPLCSETEASGLDSLNLAACHACVLLPETSCEESNVLLDRGLLTGTPSQPDLGYFSSLV
jgi:hypothetical protein